jgi:hypothetical protein
MINYNLEMANLLPNPLKYKGILRKDKIQFYLFYCNLVNTLLLKCY